MDYVVVGRRPGDMGRLVAKVGKAKEIMGWETKKNLDDICKSCVNFLKVTLEKN